MDTIADSAINEHRAFRPYDRQLGSLLSIVLGFDDEKVENSFGVSLMVKGTLISGLAVTQERWTQESVVALRDNGSEGGKFVANVMDIVTAESAKLKAENAEDIKAKEANRAPKGRDAINLLDATVKVGDSLLTYKTMRVLIDSVDAWSIGNLNTSHV